MSQLTKEQQQKIIENIDSLYNTTFLRCDGYLVAARLVRHKNKLVVEVYVDGFMKGKWCGVFTDEPLPEETRRFYRPSVRARCKAKEIKMWEKIYGKRKCRKKGIYDKVTLYYLHWLSAKSFVLHLMKNNDSIEMIDHEAYQEELRLKLEESEIENEQTD